MSTASEGTAGESAAAAPKKKSKLPLIIIAVVVLAALGGGGFFFMRKSAAASDDSAKAGKTEKSKKASSEDEGADDADAKDADPKSEKASSKDGEKSAGPDSDKSAKPSLTLPDDSKVTQVIELQPFVVNLADADASRYLRVTVSVGIGGEAGTETKADPLFVTRVRNAMLAVLTTKTSGEVLTVEGKDALRKQLLKASQQASEEPEVLAIYMTEFIVQM